MKTLKVDLKKMSSDYGLPTEDVVRNGIVMMRDEPIWNSEALRRAVAEVQEMAQADTFEQVEIMAHCPNWVTTALTYAAAPAVGHAKIGPGGKFEMDLLPFAIGEIDPSLNTRFAVQEQGDRVYVTLYPSTDAEAGAHGFDLTRFSEIKVPEVPTGKIVMLAGEMVNPIAVSMALAYAPEAKAVYLRFHDASHYYCAITNSADIELGHMIAAE